MKLASNIKSSFKSCRKYNHHFVFIEAPARIVGPEIIVWGEAAWWPKKCSMRFIRLRAENPMDQPVDECVQPALRRMFTQKYSADNPPKLKAKALQRRRVLQGAIPVKAWGSINKTPGEIKVGTRYQQKVMLPLAPRWDVEVTKLTVSQEIERTFLNGIFRGAERVTIEERLNGTRVDYEMHYTLRGVINKVLWKLLFEGMHDKNIEMILAALKKFTVEKYNKETLI